MKTVVKKRLLLIALVLCLAISAVACGASNQSAATTQATTAVQTTTAAQATTAEKKGVTLTFGIPTQWANKASFKQLIDKYNQTGNTVEVQALDDSNYINLTLTKIATNDCWDLVWAKVGVEATQYNVDKNFVDLSNEPWISRVSDNALSGFLKVNGKVYAAPFDGSGVMGVLYNKKVFQDLNITIPKTETEFQAVCDTIKAKGITPIYFPTKDLWPIIMYQSTAWPAQWVADPTILDKLNTNQMKWADVPGALAEAKRMVTYYNKGYFNKDLITATYDMALKNIADGTAAMWVVGDWVAGDFATKYPTAPIGMFTRPTESGDNYVAVTAPDGLYISNNSKNPDSAKDFVNFWVTPENQNVYFAENSMIPVFKDQTVAKLDPMAADVFPEIQAGKWRAHFASVYKVPYDNDLFKLYQDMLVSGGKTPEQMIKAMDDYFGKMAKDLKMPGF